MKPKYIITGSSGLIGKSLVNLLKEEGESIIYLSRKKVENEEWYFFDLKESVDLPEHIFSSPHHIIHLASLHNGNSFDEYYESNVFGTINLLKHSNSNTLSTHLSSSFSVYGNGNQEGILEGHNINPETLLAKTRFLAESEVLSSASCSKFIYRTRFLLGKNDNNLMPNLVNLAKKGISISDNKSRFGLLLVDDFAKIIYELAKNSKLFENKNIFNCHYKACPTLSELLNLAGSVEEPNRVNIPGFIVSFLDYLPVQFSLKTKLTLLGLNHYGDISKLESSLKKINLDHILDKDLKDISKALY